MAVTKKTSKLSNLVLKKLLKEAKQKGDVKKAQKIIKLISGNIKAGNVAGLLRTKKEKAFPAIKVLQGAKKKKSVVIPSKKKAQEKEKAAEKRAKAAAKKKFVAKMRKRAAKRGKRS
jgi:hypothetical protein